MGKTKVTYTIDESHSLYVQAIANSNFEGIESMAIRKIIAEHSRVPKEMWEKILK